MTLGSSPAPVLSCHGAICEVNDLKDKCDPTSFLTVSTMSGRERAGQETTGSEGHQGLLRTLAFDDANVQMTHYVHKPQNLKSTLVCVLGEGRGEKEGRRRGLDVVWPRNFFCLENVRQSPAIHTWQLFLQTVAHCMGRVSFSFFSFLPSQPFFSHFFFFF